MAKITYIKEGENNTSVLIVDGVQVNSSNYGVIPFCFQKLLK